MSQVLRQLRTDHSHMARLLMVLDSQIVLVESVQAASFSLMADALRYMTGYGDRYHHPREDLVFERLRVRDSGLAAVIDSLVREHLALGRKGADLLQMLDSIVDGELVERQVLAATARDYVDFLRSHMTREDTMVFPRAESALAEGDWTCVERSLQGQEDPLFGRILREDFADLYHHIMREAQ